MARSKTGITALSLCGLPPLIDGSGPNGCRRTERCVPTVRYLVAPSAELLKILKGIVKRIAIYVVAIFCLFSAVSA
jgi:hypothetical protein